MPAAFAETLQVNPKSATIVEFRRNLTHLWSEPLGLDHGVHSKVMSLAETKEMTYLDPQALNGTNDLQLGVFAKASHGQVLLSAVFDNLGKGASGAAFKTSS